MDSIVVSKGLATTNCNIKCFSKLCNVIGNTPIPNTQHEFTVLNTGPSEYVFSGNIYDDLTEGEMKLGQRIRSELESTTLIRGFLTYRKIK
ncbi:hypothetical protein [Aquimarina sp. 2201CG5-10]|uniref:hypothetical protein n=1 Tax=Aquimarina callyspongiae TaxID=3098150 RepID=UPI002AB33039|nr:hypothetical protein [Aquimarina sp. 2201CG5-10]MDY8135402.1 hypothetical protein [Aquimarina sp. 2201CG5-10]